MIFRPLSNLDLYSQARKYRSIWSLLGSIHPETPVFRLPLERLCWNEGKGPSFPRKRESREFEKEEVTGNHTIFSYERTRLDARLRGHDEL
jgi:hypothetical protein